MAFDVGYKNWIDTNSDREADFYARKLDIDTRRNNFKNQKVDKKCEIINHIISDLHDYKEQNKLIKRLKSSYNNSIIENTEWFWLKPDMSREVNWMWGFIQIHLNDNIPNTKHNLELFYNKLNTQKIVNPALNTEIKFYQLAYAFEYTETSVKTLDVISKKLFNIWQDTGRNKSIINFLDENNNDQCEWTINYLTYQRACLDISKYFTPMSKKDNYWYSIAIFDLIDDDRDKQLILLKMRKAWTQHKYRNKQNGKKSYSISMSPDTKRKLDDIVTHTDGKICDSIERLINEEYNRLF